MLDRTNSLEQEKPEKLVEGIDYYFENGLMVLSAHFLKKRGYCCDNGCRNCPYPKETQEKIPETD